MDEIRPWLYVGSYRDCLNISHLSLMSINAMLQLSAKVEQPGIDSLYLSFEHGAPVPFELFTKGVAFIREHKKQGHRILVACGAGINRSSAFATAALKDEEDLSLLEAFRAVKIKHPESIPYQPVWESLCNYYNEFIPYLDIMLIKS